MTYNIVDPDMNDQVISTHKTEAAATRALAKATQFAYFHGKGVL
jgi:hypothetical protein